MPPPENECTFIFFYLDLAGREEPGDVQGVCTILEKFSPELLVLYRRAQGTLLIFYHVAIEDGEHGRLSGRPGLLSVDLGFSAAILLWFGEKRGILFSNASKSGKRLG